MSIININHESEDKVVIESPDEENLKLDINVYGNLSDLYSDMLNNKLTAPDVSVKQIINNIATKKLNIVATSEACKVNLNELTGRTIVVLDIDKLDSDIVSSYTTESINDLICSKTKLLKILGI